MSASVKKPPQVELLDTNTRVTKAQHVTRDNVNYLWKVGLSRSVRNLDIENHEKKTGIDPIAMEAIGRLLADESAASLSNQSIALFCTSCKVVFMPGINCTVRTLSKRKKKHELSRRRKRKKKSRRIPVNKGLVYTCKMCSNKDTIGTFVQNNRKTQR